MGKKKKINIEYYLNFQVIIKFIPLNNMERKTRATMKNQLFFILCSENTSLT